MAEDPFGRGNGVERDEVRPRAGAGPVSRRQRHQIVGVAVEHEGVAQPRPDAVRERTSPAGKRVERDRSSVLRPRPCDRARMRGHGRAARPAHRRKFGCQPVGVAPAAAPPSRARRAGILRLPDDGVELFARSPGDRASRSSSAAAHRAATTWSRARSTAPSSCRRPRDSDVEQPPLELEVLLERGAWRAPAGPDAVELVLSACDLLLDVAAGSGLRRQPLVALQRDETMQASMQDHVELAALLGTDTPARCPVRLW